MKKKQEQENEYNLGETIGAFLIILLIMCVGSGLLSFLSYKDMERKRATKHTLQYNDEFVKVINEKSKLPATYMGKYDYIREGLMDYTYYTKYKDNTKILLSEEYHSTDKKIRFKYSGYPKKEDDIYLVMVEISTEKYNVFGIKPNKTTMGDAVNKLKEYNFEIETEENFYTILKHGNYKVRLELSNIEDIGERNQGIVRKIILSTDRIE